MSRWAWRVQRHIAWPAPPAHSCGKGRRSAHAARAGQCWRTPSVRPAALLVEHGPTSVAMSTLRWYSLPTSSSRSGLPARVWQRFVGQHVNAFGHGIQGRQGRGHATFSFPAGGHAAASHPAATIHYTSTTWALRVSAWCSIQVSTRRAMGLKPAPLACHGQSQVGVEHSRGCPDKKPVCGREHGKDYLRPGGPPPPCSPLARPPTPRRSPTWVALAGQAVMHLFMPFSHHGRRGRGTAPPPPPVAAHQESGVETIINAAGAVNVARVVAQGGLQDVHRAVLAWRGYRGRRGNNGGDWPS